MKLNACCSMRMSSNKFMKSGFIDMPTILKAALDGSPMIRLHHFSLTAQYLDIAHRHADPSGSALSNGDPLSRALIAITFSAMCLEAFANEAAEDAFSDEELGAFISLTGRFKKPKGISGIGHKICLLLAQKRYPALPMSLAAGIEDVVDLRNSLVHYKLTSAAGKSYHAPVSSMRTDDGGVMWSIDLMQLPVQVEAPFLAKINESSAVRSYNTAYDFACWWATCEKVQGGPAGFSRLA